MRHLGFRYGVTVALRDISLDLPENRVTGLIGPSGCGKSTLLRVLNRLYGLYPDQHATGEVHVDGQDILGPDVDTRRLRARVGMVFQTATTFPMSVYENIAFGIRLHQHLPRAELNQRVEAALTVAALWSEVKDTLHAPPAICQAASSSGSVLPERSPHARR
jgi:phosphate transport system ATP-binding protein